MIDDFVLHSVHALIAAGWPGGCYHMDTFEYFRDFAWPAKEERIQSDCSGEFLEFFISDVVAWRVGLDDMSHGKVEALLKSVKVWIRWTCWVSWFGLNSGGCWKIERRTWRARLDLYLSLHRFLRVHYYASLFYFSIIRQDNPSYLSFVCLSFR